jgi:hypothetical protein
VHVVSGHDDNTNDTDACDRMRGHDLQRRHRAGRRRAMRGEPMRTTAPGAIERCSGNARRPARRSRGRLQWLASSCGRSATSWCDQRRRRVRDAQRPTPAAHRRAAQFLSTKDLQVLGLIVDGPHVEVSTRGR